MKNRAGLHFIQELKEKRLFDLYLLMKRSGKYSSFVEICRELEITPMPIHYISYYRANIVYKEYFLRGRTVKYRHLPKTILYNSFILTCKKLMKQGLTDTDDIICKALLSKAPCIGNSESQIRRILRKQGAH